MQSPYIDLLNREVAQAAKNALDTETVEFALAFVPKGQELEVIEAFEKALKVREHGPESRDLAERYFFDTVVRIHRSSWRRTTQPQASILDFTELDRIIDDAVATGYPEELEQWLRTMLEKEISSKLGLLEELGNGKNEGVEKGRSFATAMLAFKEWAFQLYEKARSPVPEVLEEAHNRSMQAGLVRE